MSREHRETETQVVVQGLAKISSKVKDDIVLMKKDEIRYLVDYYYQKQDDRKTKYSQLRAIGNGVDSGQEDNNSALEWLAMSTKNEEVQIKNMLDIWTNSLPVGRWMKDVVGIGPVIAAGLMAYFDVTSAPHYNSFHSYAGLNDNRIPWLGKEKAAALVKDIMKEYTDIMDERVHDFERLCDMEGNEITVLKKSMAKLSKLFGEDLFSLTANILAGKETESALDSKQQKALNTFTSQLPSGVISRYLNTGLEELCNLCHYINNPNILTSYTIAIAENKSGRNSTSIYNGLKIVRDSKKAGKKSYYTKDDLESYLAKPPYNKSLKVLCWKIGDSFVKRCNNDKSLYGRLYKYRKAYEIQKNLNGEYAEFAAKTLASKNFKDKETIEIYKSGRLPLGHIENRARRYAVKIFISHVYEAMYIDYYHKCPPKVYPISMLGHVDYIPPEVPYCKYMEVPNEYYEMYPGSFEQYYKVSGIDFDKLKVNGGNINKEIEFLSSIKRGDIKL